MQVSLKLFLVFGQTMRCFRLHVFFRSRFIMYLVLALLKVAFVNFTLNEYMIWWWWNGLRALR